MTPISTFHPRLLDWSFWSEDVLQNFIALIAGLSPAASAVSLSSFTYSHLSSTRLRLVFVDLLPLEYYHFSQGRK